MKLAWKHVIVAFIVGVMVGIVGARGCVRFMVHRHWRSGQFQARMLQRFSSKLQLTPDQRTHVAAILDQKRQKIDALRAEIQPKFQEIRTSTAAEIRALLTPEQQQKFDAMNAKSEARAKRFHERFHREGEEP